MGNNEITSRLIEIKKSVSELGLEYLETQTPFPLGDVGIIMKPFISIDSAINQAMKKFSANDMPGLIPKTSTFKDE